MTNIHIYRNALLNQGLTADELKAGTDEENFYGLLLTKEGVPIIAGEGGSMYLSKKKALEIHSNDPSTQLLNTLNNNDEPIR